jgi:hypothetical protein
MNSHVTSVFGLFYLQKKKMRCTGHTCATEFRFIKSIAIMMVQELLLIVAAAGRGGASLWRADTAQVCSIGGFHVVDGPFVCFVAKAARQMER